MAHMTDLVFLFSSTTDEYSPQRKVSEKIFLRLLRQEEFCKTSLLPISSNCFWAIVHTFPADDIVLYFYQNARCSQAVRMCQTPRISRLLEQSTFPPIEPERERAPVQMHTEGDQGR